MMLDGATVGDLADLMLLRRYTPVKDRLAAVVERRRGRSLRAVARAIKRSVSFVKTWNDRFKVGGAGSLWPTSKNVRRSKLTEEQRLALRLRILAGPTATDQVAIFTIADIQRILLAEHHVEYSRSAISRLLRRMQIVRRRPRPRHAKQVAGRVTTWRDETLPATLRRVQELHPTSRLEIWFQDESRFGQKTKSTRVWTERGSNPTFVDQNGKLSAYIFGAVNPSTGARVGLVATHCDSEIMQLHLDEVSRSVEHDAHVVMVLDGAGWHQSKSLTIPPNITLCPLPPYSPELNPIERLWLRIKERYLSFRQYRDIDAIISAGVDAWNKVTAAEVMSICRVGAAPTRQGGLLKPAAVG